MEPGTQDGADDSEDVLAQPVAIHDRNSTLGDWRTIRAWTHFRFPGRAGAYSTVEWRWWCFDAVNEDANHPSSGHDIVYRLRERLGRVPLPRPVGVGVASGVSRQLLHSGATPVRPVEARYT